MKAVERLYLECERARAQGVLIKRVSQSDKEYHFQNWVGARLKDAGILFDDPGRNTYPDFRLVHEATGFEVKGLAWPGREADYDSNSQVPTGLHNGREVYYVFGRYPKDIAGLDEYPVTDIVICHGSFLNADTSYVHKNKSFRGFGSYGDILVRDRKMYVVPTPFHLVRGTAGIATLVLPEEHTVSSPDLIKVGALERREVDRIVGSYEFDLETNELHRHYRDNPTAGRIHKFFAYRSKQFASDTKVEMNPLVEGGE